MRKERPKDFGTNFEDPVYYILNFGTFRYNFMRYKEFSLEDRLRFA